MEKLYTSKTFSQTAGGRRHTPHPTPLGPLLAISYKNHKKNLAYFSHMAPLILLFFFTKKQSQEERTGGGGGGGGGGWHNAPLNIPMTALHLFRDMIIIGKESSIAFSAF